MATSPVRAAAAALAVALAAGCGGPPAAVVTGTVTLDGAPVAGGTISFIPVAGGAVTALIQPDGTYRAEGVPVAEVAVTLVPPPPDVDPKVMKESKGASPRRPPAWPVRYADAAQSGLTLTVQPGPNTFDAKMTK
jgi:hypothetical protein